MLLPPSVIWYPILESTNTHLLRKFEAEGSCHLAGKTASFWSAAVAAKTQSAGRGQRQNTWADVPGESLLLSVAAPPAHPLEGQALFSFSIAVAIANALEQHCTGLEVKLKWPNDIMAAGRKLGGILIENVLRGAHWQLAVVGVGINVLQKTFPPALPNAVSLLQLMGHSYAAKTLATELCAAIFNAVTALPAGDLLLHYNERLFGQGTLVEFSSAGTLWRGKLEGVEADGRLRVLDIGSGKEKWCVHGVDKPLPNLPQGEGGGRPPKRVNQ